MSTATYEPAERLVPRKAHDRSIGTLFDAAGQPTPHAAAVPKPPGPTAAFDRYHAAHPEVLVRLIEMVRASGPVQCKRLFARYGERYGTAPNTSFWSNYGHLVNDRIGRPLVAVRARRAA